MTLRLSIDLLPSPDTILLLPINDTFIISASQHSYIMGRLWLQIEQSGGSPKNAKGIRRQEPLLHNKKEDGIKGHNTFHTVYAC